MDRRHIMAHNPFKRHIMAHNAFKRLIMTQKEQLAHKGSLYVQKEHNDYI